MALFDFVRGMMIALTLTAGFASAAFSNESPPPQEGAAEAAKQESEAPVAPGFLAVPALNISVVKQNRIRGVLAVNAVLDIARQDAMDVAIGLMPRLTGGYASALAKWSNIYQGVHEPANVVAIKNQLQQVTNQVLGRDDVQVLLQNALLKPAA